MVDDDAQTSTIDVDDETAFDNLDEIEDEDDHLGSGEVMTVADDESSAEEAAMHVIEDEG